MDQTMIKPISATSRFRGDILRKVYRVWLVRKFLPVFLVEVAVLSFVLYQLAKTIFLQRVLENAMNVFFQNPPHVVSFFFWAFIDAKVFTKTLVIAVSIALVLVIRLVTQGLLRLFLVRENYFGNITKE